MAKDLKTNNEISSDTQCGASRDTGSDFDNEIANEEGTDLNASNKDYSYEDYQESEEISNPFAVDTRTDLNEYNSGYTNEEIRDSLNDSDDDI